MGRLPTEPEVRQLTPLAEEALEHALLKIDDLWWQRLEKILGTSWEYSDVHPPQTTDENGNPVQAKQDRSTMRSPLSLIIRPGLMESLKKTLQPSASMLDSNQAAQGIIDMAELSKDAFLEEIQSGMGEVPSQNTEDIKNTLEAIRKSEEKPRIPEE